MSVDNESTTVGMAVDDETHDAHFTIPERLRLMTTRQLAACLDVPIARMRTYLQGRVPTAYQARGGGCPDERLWRVEIVEELSHLRGTRLRRRQSRK